MIKCFRHFANYGIELEIERAGLQAERIDTGLTNEKGEPLFEVTTFYNADYIMAEDTKVDEPREVFIALKHTAKTRAKADKGEPIEDSEYEAVEIATLAEATDAVRVKSEVRVKNIQKTGIICPDCYKPTDFVIWGVHKQ